ncbi:hypothetical protein SY86_05560 [Erwinia tracheiphila]|uniref:Uncharacterized protein n=1 Tax=Erwinia tracheiphila TaxID=65700 RepID=A0A0M2K7W0_9GAMM|nr:hypothetical protein AV903_09705 [Erwinia tracheiphila]KKF35014.1 hypothetical protein SY86_05560 [Erwinia tracheiphila]
MGEVALAVCSLAAAVLVHPQRGAVNVAFCEGGILLSTKTPAVGEVVCPSFVPHMLKLFF